MFVIMYKANGALNCEQAVIGPFQDYMDAEDFLLTVPVLQPATVAGVECNSGWRYIRELTGASEFYNGME